MKLENKENDLQEIKNLIKEYNYNLEQLEYYKIKLDNTRTTGLDEVGIKHEKEVINIIAKLQSQNVSLLNAINKIKIVDTKVNNIDEMLLNKLNEY